VPLRLGWYLVVQLAVLIAWIFFRSGNVDGAVTFVRNLGHLKLGALDGSIMRASIFLLPPAAMHLYGFLVEKSVIRPLGRLGQAALAGAMLFAIIAIHGDAGDFLYFQF